MTGHALRLLRVGLNVSDLPRAQAYYRDALGFTAVTAKEADPNWARLLEGDLGRARTARLRLGEQELELVEFDPPGAKYPPDSTAADLWFQRFAIVTNDMATAYQRLKQHGVTSITQDGPQRLPPAAGAVVAYKFRDADGHPLELIHFPPGIGDPAWQGVSPGVTIGIDQSALSVANAAHSVAFYDLLGLSPRSRQLNSGPEQDRLDGLSKVAVEVIGLSPPAAQTPHVELLCYQTPRGRPCRPSRQARDIAASRLIFQVEDLAGLVHALASAGVVASPVLDLSSRSRAAIVRDPDGHAIVLLEGR
jgi:catechol 2,3-dioxygenase-like lactoylglutathione lyase family enzyme